MYPIGTQIRKRFDDEYCYTGLIIGHDPIENYYHIHYDDGDAEDYTMTQVKRQLPGTTTMVMKIILSRSSERVTGIR